MAVLQLLDLVPRAVLPATALVVPADAPDVWQRAAERARVAYKDLVFKAQGQNDHLTLQSAIDALPSYGGSVVLGPGTLVLGGQVNVNRTGITLAGMGRASVLSLSVNSHFVVVTGDHVRVQDMAFDYTAHPASPTQGIGVYFSGASYCLAQGLVGLSTYYTVAIFDASSHIQVRDCWALNNLDDGFTAGGPGTKHITMVGLHAVGSTGEVSSGQGAGIELEDGVEHVLVMGCELVDCIVGLQVQSHAGQPTCRHLAVVACSMKNNSQAGLRVERFTDPDRHRFIVLDNITYELCGAGGSGTRGSLDLRKVEDLIATRQMVEGTPTGGGNLQGIYLNDVVRARVSGQVRGAQGNGIMAQSCQDLDLDMHIYNSNRSGVGGSAFRGIDTVRVRVRGAAVDDQTTPTQQYAIRTTGTSDDWDIDALKMSGNTLGSLSLVGKNRVRDIYPFQRLVTGNVTLDPYDNVVMVDTAAPRTITLPSAALVKGKSFLIKDAAGQAGTNNITVDTQGTETIDGAASVVINTNYGSQGFLSDGSNWFRV